MTLASLVAQGGGVLAAEPSQLLPAREQMAFTLGFHIILVPFGVAFTFLMLIANYRGIRRGDDTAMLLARRWSQVAGVAPWPHFWTGVPVVLSGIGGTASVVAAN